MSKFRILFLILLCGLNFSCSNRDGSKPLVSYRIPPQTRKPVVILDAGHGGTDHGASAHGITEKDGALQTTLLTKKYLNNLGYRVILTRDRDQHIPLKHRSSIANRYKEGIFVSIHLNSAPSKAANGIEVFWCDSGKAKESRHSHMLASNVLDNLIQTTAATSRGVKKGRFHVIRETEIPSILVEAGFITNLDESNKLKESAYQNQLANAIATGVHSFLQSSSTK